MALGLTRDSSAAADLVQTAFLRAIERRHQLHGDPLPWIKRILYRLVLDSARSGAHEIAVAAVEESWRDDAYTVDAETAVERGETRAELEDALVRLPFIYRAAVVLHDVEGLTVAEAAALQSIGVPAAKQRLRRGRMALVSALAAGAERREALSGVPMRCWDARRMVSDYLDGHLDPASRARVEAHLERCPTCPPLYAALVGVHASLGRLRDADAVIPPQMVERLLAVLRRQTD
jgi:RNA polymerase sigma-70 factor (ECF subfamily)